VKFPDGPARDPDEITFQKSSSGKTHVQVRRGAEILADVSKEPPPPLPTGTPLSVSVEPFSIQVRIPSLRLILSHVIVFATRLSTTTGSVLRMKKELSGFAVAQTVCDVSNPLVDIIYW
jgi:hypothetical protein